MPAATRLLVAFVLLVCAFIVLVGVAVFSLVMAGQEMLAAVVALAGLTGATAGAVTYWFLRREGEDEPGAVEVEPLVPLTPTPEPAPQARLAPQGKPVLRRAPLRVQAMPVAKLPPAYVDAVMRGAQARRNAWKVQAPHH